MTNEEFSSDIFRLCNCIVENCKNLTSEEKKNAGIVEFSNGSVFVSPPNFDFDIFISNKCISINQPKKLPDEDISNRKVEVIITGGNKHD